MILTHGANSLKVEDDSKVTIGGRDYPVVKIGNQLWLAENLDFKFSGCNIGGSGTPSTPNAWYYNNDEATYGIDGTRKCGLLYNWYACKLLNDNRSTLCPGWHVPTNDEWTALANAVGGTEVAGTRLKATDVAWATSWGGTDDYDFATLPAGARYLGSFDYVGFLARLWTADDSSSTDAYNIRFNTGTSVSLENSIKIYAHSVRLVRDAT